MDLGNLYNRELKRLEDDTVAQIERYQEFYNANLDDPTYISMCGAQGLSTAQFLNKLIVSERKFLARRIQKLKQDHNLSAGHSHTWIGINPDPSNSDLESLASRTAELVSKYKMFAEYAYSVEQHTYNGIRPHVHMLIHDTPKRHRVRETISKHFDISQNFVETQTFRRNYMYDEHIAYIKGYKKEEKQAYIQADKIDREQLGIADYYTNILS